MKAKLLSAAKKLAAIATSAMFLGVTMGAVSAYSMSSLPSPFVQNGHVNATFVVGANAAPVDIIGAIAIATGLTAAAGSSHSGSGSFATIGKLVTSSKSATYETLYTTPGVASAFNKSFSKPSLTLDAQNFTIGSTHYAAIENLSLLGTTGVNAPYINSNLGVTFPPGSVELVSYVAAGNTTAVGATQKFTKGLQYLIGKTMYTFISNATKSTGYLGNVSLGAMQTFNNVKIPSTLTVGTNTIDVQSVGSLVFPSHTYNTIDVSINGGPTQVLNLSGTYTNVNGTGVTITVGPSYSTIGGVTTLDYLEASSVGITQNVTANTKGDANLFGLGSNYNVSYVPINSTYKATGTELTFFNTNNITLPYSFSASNSFELPVNLTSVSLEKLTPTWGNSKNVTVTTGQKATDTFTAVVEKNTTASPVALLAFTHGLPDVAYGVSFRGNNISTTTGLFTVPNLLLYHYQKIYTGESPYQFLVGESEYIYPVPTNPAFAVTTAPSGLSSANSSAFFFNTTSGPYANVSTNLQPSKVVYELPNGNMFAVRFSPVYDTNNTYYNFTSGVDLFRPTIQNLTNNTLGKLSSPIALSSSVVDNASFKVSATLPTLGWNSSKVNSSIAGIKHTIPTSNFFLNGTSKTLYLNLSNGTKFLKIILNPVFDSNISYYNSSHANMTFKYLNDSWEERAWNVTGVTNLFSSNPVTNNSKVAGYTVDFYNYNVTLSNRAVNHTAPTSDFGFANESKMIRNLTVSGPIVFTVGGSGSTVGATLKDTEKVWNSSTLLNYTASTASSPTVNAIVLNKNYTFGGYNVSFSALPFSLGNKAKAPSNTPYYAHLYYYGYSNQSVYGMEMKLVGPSVTMNINSKEFGLTPGVSGLYYTSNGTEFSSFDNGVLGSVAFNGNDVVFTEPTGTAISIPIKENTTNFATYFPTVKNQSADTWGTVVNFGKIPKYGNSSSEGTLYLNVPSENYSLLVSGSQVLSGLQNYSVGQSQPGGVLKSVGGVSPVSASSLVSGFQMPTLDTSFTASSNSEPVIVVGGPAVNKIAAELLTGSSTPIYGKEFQNKTGVGPNEALVEYFSNSSAVGNQPALLVAGYYGNDTQIASEALYESLIGTPVVSINGTKVVLSVSSLSLSGVTVVS